MYWRRLFRTIAVLSLMVCMLAGCGDGPGVPQEIPPERKPEAEPADEELKKVITHIDDEMFTSRADDLEFIIIRIKDEYFDIRRDGMYLRLHSVYDDGAGYPEIEEGSCARVVADVDILNGGVAGYQNDYSLKDVKDCNPITYDEAAAELELADAGDTSISMYDHVLIYHHDGSSYLLCKYWDKTVAYKDGEFYAEYDDEIIEDLDTPEPFLESVNPAVEGLFSIDPVKGIDDKESE